MRAAKTAGDTPPTQDNAPALFEYIGSGYPDSKIDGCVLSLFSLLQVGRRD